MATLESLLKNVTKTVQEPSEDDTSYTKRINTAINYVAGKVLLPKLKSFGVAPSVPGVDTTPIPEEWEYMRNLFTVTVTDAAKITILNSSEQLERIFPDYLIDQEAGQIQYVFVDGDNLVYYPIPAEEVTMKCQFYKIPTELKKDLDSPTCIPVDMHEDLIESHVCWKTFNIIEDGVDGVKRNTNTHKSIFDTALEDLEGDVKTGQARPLPRRPSNWI